MSQPSDTDDVLTAAFSCAERGWAVFPLWWPLLAGGCGCRRPTCDRVGKHPIGFLVPNGLMGAGTDADTIRAWWSSCPRANVGIRTGAVAGLVVLDETGTASLRELIAAHGRFAAAWIRTGSGLARLHGASAAVWATPKGSWVPGSTRAATAATRDGAQPAQEPAAPVGQRNGRLNLAAYRLGRLLDGGLAQHVVVEVLLVAARTAGLGDHEAMLTIRSGLEACLRNPRRVA